MKNKAFLNGAIILVIFNLLGKVIGSVYRISLASVLGAGGMGQYQLVFPLYCLILTIATSGMPASISKLVAELNEKKRYKDSKKLLFISILILSGISLVGSAVIVFGAKFISNFQGNKNAYICYYGIAPAVVFVGVLSAFRGYFQGNLQMFPTALSGLVEQVCKLFFGLYFAKKFSIYGTEYSVFGALLGISISEFFAFVFLCFCFIFRSRKRFKDAAQESYTKRFLSRSLLLEAMPMTLGGLVLPVTSMVDSFLVVNLLMLTGVSSELATSLLGIQAGVVEPLVNLPVTISVALAVVLLPSITKLNQSSEKEEVKSLILKVFQITLSIAICCALCFIVFGGQALEFLYGRSFTPNELIIATKLLFLASVNIILISLVQISASVLQGLNHSKHTVRSLLIGCVAKIVLEVALLLTPGVGIIGATISGGVCYFIVLVLNLTKIKKLTGVRVTDGYFYISIQSCVVAVTAFSCNFACGYVFSSRVSLFVAGSIAVIVFLVSYYFLFMHKKAPNLSKQNYNS